MKVLRELFRIRGGVVRASDDFGELREIYAVLRTIVEGAEFVQDFLHPDVDAQGGDCSKHFHRVQSARLLSVVGLESQLELIVARLASSGWSVVVHSPSLFYLFCRLAVKFAKWLKFNAINFNNRRRQKFAQKGSKTKEMLA